MLGIRKGLLSNSSEFFLDGMPSAFGAFALHRINRNYSGHLIRLQRNSDNAELDFGLGQSELNVSEMLDWLGSSSRGNVVRWYDQSGSNLTMVTSGGAPILFANSAAFTLTTKIALAFYFGRGLRSAATDTKMITSVGVFRASTTTFSTYHNLFGSPNIVNDTRSHTITNQGGTGMYDIPPLQPGATFFCNGISRTFATNNMFLPRLVSQANLYISATPNLAENTPLYYIGSSAPSNIASGFCVQSCAIGFTSFLSENDRVKLEKRIMTYYQII